MLLWPVVLCLLCTCPVFRPSSPTHRLVAVAGNAGHSPSERWRSPSKFVFIDKIARTAMFDWHGAVTETTK